MNTPVDFTKAKVGAILNTASGSCDESSREKLETMLREAGIENPKIWCGGAEEVGAFFTEAAQEAPDVLIVLGGDGTIRTAAEACTSAGPLLIALPGGTMNMLPKALYGERSWEDALKETLKNPSVTSVSGGTVAGKQFFIAAIIGAPALWAKAREAIRGGDIPDAIDQGVIALQNMFALKVTYSFSESSSGEAEALTVICPLISDVLKDTERAFEAAVIHVENAAEVLGLASTAAFGKWRDDEHVTSVKTKKVHIASGTDIPLILDGETVEAGNLLDVVFIPEAFKALVPAAD